MKTKLLAAATAGLGILFSINAVSAATYTIDIDYDLLDGTVYNCNCGAAPQFTSQYTPVGLPNLPVNLPTLYAGDVINTTINFTRGLALTINDPGHDRELFQVIFFPNNYRNSASGFVSTFSQLSLLHAHGDLLNPPVLQSGSGHVSGPGACCVSGSVAGDFTDGSFSFRGFSIVTTILDLPVPFGPTDQMSFDVLTPLPSALPLFASGLIGFGRIPKIRPV